MKKVMTVISICLIPVAIVGVIVGFIKFAFEAGVQFAESLYENY